VDCRQRPRRSPRTRRPRKLNNPAEFYEAFTRTYAPVIADNLTAKLDGRPLAFTCESHRHQVLDHLRCDFVFRAPWKPAAEGKFTFYEGNYELESGRVNPSLVAEAPIRLVGLIQPDEELKNRPATELRPGDEGRLRKASATVMMGGEPEPGRVSRPCRSKRRRRRRVRPACCLLLDSRQGLLVLLALAVLFGTPM
jgi:hypothetical protein